MNPQVSLALREHRCRPVPVADLARELGLSPRQLGEALDELARRGFVIESHPMQGLQLVQGPASLVADEIRWNLAGARVGRHVRCEESTPSTNDLAWQVAAGGPDVADGLVVFAEYQSAGRGRRGNLWLAPPHTSILASVVLWMPASPSQAAHVTRAAAVAVAEAIEDQADLDVGIKWPNDIVVDDRKVGGILVEARPAAGRAGPVVLGVGINCFQEEETFPNGIRADVASLKMLGVEVDRTLLARSLLARLEAIAPLANPAGFLAVAGRAESRCRTLGRRITLQEGLDAYTGEVIDLDPDYGLILRLDHGGIRRFPAMTSHVIGRG